MWEQILPGLRIKLFMTILLGVVYPLAITGISQAVFPHQANGSLITEGGRVVGSELIGQTSPNLSTSSPIPLPPGQMVMTEHPLVAPTLDPPAKSCGTV